MYNCQLFPKRKWLKGRTITTEYISIACFSTVSLFSGIVLYHLGRRSGSKERRTTPIASSLAQYCATQDWYNPISLIGEEEDLFSSEYQRESDTEKLLGLLTRDHGGWLVPFRCETLDRIAKGKNFHLRFRRWLPPVVITPKNPESGYAKPSGTPLQIGTSNPSRTKMEKVEKEAYDVFVDPTAMDVLLRTIIPMSDPRYYRIYKEVSFKLVRKISERIKTYMEMGHSLEDFPSFPIRFDSKGNIISPTFEQYLEQFPWGPPGVSRAEESEILDCISGKD